MGDMKTEQLQPGQGPVEIGAGGEAAVERSYVPPEHRIPTDQWPESLRQRFPEGMP